MALLSQAVAGEVGLRILLSPLGSSVVMRTACCAVGIGLPVYSTFKAIEKKDQNEQERLLVYWAAFGSFSLVEIFTDKLLTWCPFYYHVKFAFLVWLQFPSNNGSKYLYTGYLRSFLLKHQSKIDRVLNRISREISKFMIAHEGEIKFFKAMAIRCATTVRSEGHNLIEGATDQSSSIDGQDASAEQ